MSNLPSNTTEKLSRRDSQLFGVGIAPPPLKTLTEAYRASEGILPLFPPYPSDNAVKLYNHIDTQPLRENHA